MNTTTKLAITASVLAALAGCSGANDAFTPGSSLPPTGIADANSFSLSREIANVEAWERDGVENTITIRAADRQNYPVPDGTVVNFRTNGGSIPSQCKTENGACSVTWISQNPRPGVNGNPGLPGIVTVLAYTNGEESFNDLNDNDMFDAGETILDLSEPFIDLNGNSTRDANEAFIDFNRNNAFDAPDGLYTGTSCVGDNTVCNRTGLLVWANTSFVMSSAPANFSYSSPLTVSTGQTASFTVTIVDVNGNPIATDSEISFTVSDGAVDPASITATGGETVFAFSYEAPATPGSVTLTVSVKSPASEQTVPDSTTITVN